MKIISRIRKDTPLGKKLSTYFEWKYSDERYIALGSVMSNGMIKVLSVHDSVKGDYRYEWISPRIMNLEIKQNNLSLK